MPSRMTGDLEDGPTISGLLRFDGDPLKRPCLPRCPPWPRLNSIGRLQDTNGSSRCNLENQPESGVVSCCAARVTSPLRLLVTRGFATSQESPGRAWRLLGSIGASTDGAGRSTLLRALKSHLCQWWRYQKMFKKVTSVNSVHRCHFFEHPSRRERPSASALTTTMYLAMNIANSPTRTSNSMGLSTCR